METNDRNLKILNFLRYLYDETRNDFVQFSMVKKMEEYEFKQASTYATQLVKLEIVKTKKDGNLVSYKWNLPYSPNIKLTDKVIESVAQFWRDRDNSRKIDELKEERKSKNKKPAEKSVSKKQIPEKEQEFVNKLSEEIEKDLAHKNTPEKNLDVISENLSFEDIVYIARSKGIHGMLILSKQVTL